MRFGSSAAHGVSEGEHPSIMTKSGGPRGSAVVLDLMLKAESKSVGIVHLYLPHAIGSGNRLLDIWPALRLELVISGVGVFAHEIEHEITTPGRAVLLERTLVIELVL